MKSIVIACVALLVIGSGLHAWNDRQDARIRSDRDMTDRIGRLIKADEREAIDVAAISMEIGTAKRFVYVKGEDFWRCPTAFGAVCRTDAMDGLVKALMDAEGVVQTSDERRLSEYGFSEHNRWRVALHGPGFAVDDDQDVQFSIELGFELPDKSGCYARRQGSRAVWALDANPWTSIGLSAVASGAPMVDGGLIARAWLEGATRFDRIDVEAPGRAFSLLLKQREVSQEDMRKGISPFYWDLEMNGVEQASDHQLSMSYNAFLFRAPFSRIVAKGPSRVRGKNERGKVVLRAEDSAVELVIGGDDGEGGVLAWFEPTGTLMSVTPEVADLLLPSAAAVMPGGTENGWARYLQAR